MNSHQYVCHQVIDPYCKQAGHRLKKHVVQTMHGCP